MLRDLLEEVAHRREVVREARRELVDVEAPVDNRLYVGGCVRQGDRDLLDGVAAGLTEVEAAYRDRVELRQPASRVLDHVSHQAQRRARRVDVRLARQELLQDVVLNRPAQLGRRDPLALADHLVHGEQDWRRRIDRERGGNPVERDRLEEPLHVGQGVDRDSDLSHLALGELVVGVEPHLRG